MNSLILLAQAPSMMGSVNEVKEQFGFAWPLFLSNCFSFILVAILLNRFAYKPVVDMLEVRRKKIEESLENADKIKANLAEAQKEKADILAKANAEATRMIEEARASAAAIGEKRTQAAISEAEQIVAKAHEATRMEHDRMLTELKREVGHLVIETTTRVTGKLLTAEDQRRISEETAGQIAA